MLRCASVYPYSFPYTVSYRIYKKGKGKNNKSVSNFSNFSLFDIFHLIFILFFPIFSSFFIFTLFNFHPISTFFSTFLSSMFFHIPADIFKRGE